MADNSTPQNSVIQEALAQNADITQLYRLVTTIANDIHSMSQSAIRSGAVPGQHDSSNQSSSAGSEFGQNGNMHRRQREHFEGSGVNQFFNAIDSTLTDSLTRDFKDAITSQFQALADGLDVDLRDLPGKIGKELTNRALSAFSNTSAGRAFNAMKDNLVNKVSGFVGRGVSTIGQYLGVDVAAAGTAAAGSAGTTVAATAGAATAGTAAAGTAAAGTAAAGFAAALGPVTVAVVSIYAGIKLIQKLWGPLIEGVGSFIKALSGAANASQENAKKFNELSKKRLQDDIQSMIKKPFEILQEAANKVMNAWDSAEGTIAATQGYTKADVQDLMASYSQRLRDEGLTRVVSAADITTNLEKVLQGGLSGKVAEEFAYIATKLGAAVPTEDFFSYASTYASIAANAIQQGQSQSDAIAYANSQLEDFASNLLYASREIAGGFSTGLSNASSLLQDAVKISTSAGTNNATQISGVLTSISAAVGAVAPDIADGLVSKIVEAATGGNGSSVTALRSLAGTGASNTEFLMSLAQDSQQVFSTLFSNLATLQKMSSDNFMEVAEGLSDIFGISMDAFARVDFSYLSDVVANMDTNNASLAQNMALLASGETTSTAEQDRMAQINKYILEEGLSYVLDNEVARQVQEHMWDEQLMREVQQTTFSVNIIGSVQDMVLGLVRSVENILNFLNPLAWAKKLGNIVAEANKADALSADLQQMLELQKVGEGNIAALRQLTAVNKDLQLIPSYLELHGQSSKYSEAKEAAASYAVATNQMTGSLNYLTSLESRMHNLQSSISSRNSDYGVASKYSWAGISKSSAKSYQSIESKVAEAYTTAMSTASEKIKKASSTRIDKYIESMDKFVQDGRTYEDWKASATKYGIRDFAAAIEEYGTTEADLLGAFQAREAKQASSYNHERDVQEDLFWETGLSFWTEVHPKFEESTLALQDMLVQTTDLQLQELIKSNNQLKSFYDQWIDYYVNHTAYTNATLSAYDVAAIRNAEKDETGDAVLALATALTSNLVDLKDPEVQQNVLLSQILLTLQAIMQQNNAATTVSLPTALSGLGLGLTT